MQATYDFCPNPLQDKCCEASLTVALGNSRRERPKKLYCLLSTFWINLLSRVFCGNLSKTTEKNCEKTFMRHIRLAAADIRQDSALNVMQVSELVSRLLGIKAYASIGLGGEASAMEKSRSVRVLDPGHCDCSLPPYSHELFASPARKLKKLEKPGIPWSKPWLVTGSVYSRHDRQCTRSDSRATRYNKMSRIG